MASISRSDYKPAILHAKVFLPDMAHENGLWMRLTRKVSIAMAVDESRHLI
jgi:hypothetical protein